MAPEPVACTLMATARLFLVASACFWDGSARTRCDTHAGMLCFVRFTRGEDRDARTGGLLVHCAKSRVMHAQNSGVVSSLKVMHGLNESL